MTDQAEPGRAGGYDPAFFAGLFAVEDRHFWFRARNQVISALTSQAVAQLSPGYRVLEVGCGDGNVLRFLERACPTGMVVGMDLYGEGLKYARTRTSCSLVQGDASRSPFGKKFQVIGIFDVLEHLPDDERILRDLWELLDDRATLLLTVPAHPKLWSYTDEAWGHCRRYRPEELRDKLEAAGYHVEYLTEYMASVYPLVWLNRKVRAKPRSDLSAAQLLQREVRIVPVFNRILSFLLSRETQRVTARKSLPFGASLLAVARKAG